MSGRVWSWLLEFPPVRDAVHREVKTAVDRVMDETEQSQNRLREKHRTALTRNEEEVADLRVKLTELTTANTELIGANASLRGEVAELTEAADREAADRKEFALRLVREQEAAAAQQWHGAVTDVFCCQSCWSFWFLSTSADRTSLQVRGPFGRHKPDCAVCADPLVALPAAKSVVFRKQADDRINRPVLPEGPRSDTVIANAELAAVAEGLSRLPKVPSRTASWIATDLTGDPDLPAKVLAEIATRTTMPVPIDGIVAGIHAFIEVGRTGRGEDELEELGLAEK